MDKSTTTVVSGEIKRNVFGRKFKTLDICRAGETVVVRKEIKKSHQPLTGKNRILGGPGKNIVSRDIKKQLFSRNEEKTVIVLVEKKMSCCLSITKEILLLSG